MLSDGKQGGGADLVDPVEAETVADNLNRHFASVGPRIADELRAQVRDGMDHPRPPVVCSARFTFQPVTLPELSVFVRRMRATRAVGLDEVQVSRISVVGLSYLAKFSSSVAVSR